MSRRITWGIGLVGAVALLWVGCGSENVGIGAAGGDPAGSTSTGSAASGATSSGSPTSGSGSSSSTGGGVTPVFETDIVPLIFSSCGAKDNACHSRVAYAATKNQNCRGWLALEDEALGSQIYGGPNDGTPTGCPDMPLYDRLIQLDAWQCSNELVRYVIPCKPDESYVIRKMDAGPRCELSPGKISDPMPQNKPVDAAELATWKAWIAAGAPRANGDKFDCGGGAGGAGGGGNGAAPQAKINHPGDMETRYISNGAFDFVGVANDQEDGMLPASALVWTSDLTGQLGTGSGFKFLPSEGTHVITLTATDSDKNTGTNSVTIIMKP